MAREQNPTIQIPRERLLQLKEIATALGGVTMGAAVGHLVRLAQRDGLVPEHIPGVSIQRDVDGVAIQFADNALRVYGPGRARELAAAIRAFALDGTDRTGVLHLELDVRIERRGNGVKVLLPRTGEEEKTFSIDLALEIADLIERTSQPAEFGGSAPDSAVSDL